MIRSPSQWRLRLTDLAIVLTAWAAVDEGWNQLHAGWMPFALALIFWGAGLSLSRTYRSDASAETAGIGGKIALDHVGITVVWGFVLHLCGRPVDWMEIGWFALIALAGLLSVRMIRARWTKSGGERLPALILAEALLSLIGFSALNGLWWDLAMPAGLLAVFIFSRTLIPAMLGLYRQPEPKARAKDWLAWLAGQAICSALLVAVAEGSAWPQTVPRLIFGASLLPLALSGLCRALYLHPTRVRNDAETGRRVALGAAAFALIQPYFTAALAGTGDAKMYAEAMQDYLAQLKAGIFPVWISQTEIAPYGSIFPFRMASYHFFFAAGLERIAGGTLNIYAVQHLTLILSAFAGIYAMYAALVAFAPAQRWESAALAFLYVACPGWLAALYGKDMYFTFMTLPWLPLLMYAIVQTFRRKNAGDFVALGGASAMIWLAHPPVGFWASGVAAASQAARLVRQRPARSDWARLGLAGLTGLALCAGLFVSLWDARSQGGGLSPWGVIMASLRRAMPQALLPVSESASQLGDFQLGYALLGLLFLGLVRSRLKSAPEQWTLLGIAVVLLALIYPIPGITPALWRCLPDTVAEISNVWPMQRIYPILAALIPLAVLPALAAWTGARTRCAFLSVLCAWSGFEASKFVRRGYAVTQTPEYTALASRIENSPMLGNWAAYLPQLPDLPLLNRLNDPRLLNRLLDRDHRTELVSNFQTAAQAGARPSAGDAFADAVPLQPGIMRASPAITLQPGRRYQLALYFADRTPAGLLQLLTLTRGGADFRYYQEIALDQAALDKPVIITAWTSGTEALPLTLLYRPSDPAYANQAHRRFLAYHLQPYADAALPIRVVSLAPYTAIVDAPQPCYLETHRFFVSGYRATVNGRSVPTSESPEHLLMLPLEPGHDEIRLEYPGPLAVRAAYWFSLIAWAGLAAWGARQAGRRLRARFRLSPAAQIP